MLDRVAKGDLIGRVVGLAGEVKDEIVAHSDGVIVAAKSHLRRSQQASRYAS